MSKGQLKEVYKEILSLVSDDRSVEAIHLIDEKISSGTFVNQLIKIKQNILNELNEDNLLRLKSTPRKAEEKSYSISNSSIEDSSDGVEGYFDAIKELQPSSLENNKEYIVDGYNIAFDEEIECINPKREFDFIGRLQLIKDVVEKLKLEKLYAEKAKKAESTLKKIAFEKELTIDDIDLEPATDFKIYKEEELTEEVKKHEPDDDDIDWLNEDFLDLYDEPDVVTEEDPDGDSESLIESITTEQRAKQVAADFIYEFDLPSHFLPVLISIFDTKSYGPSKSLIIRGINEGYTIKEILLAREVVSFWKSQDRFATKFSRLGYNCTSYTKYNVISLSDAMLILNSFVFTPELEEVQHFLELEYDRWYHEKNYIQRFKSFYSYLFKYRLNCDERFIDFRDDRVFANNVGYDELSNPKYMNQKCRELELLNSLGILTFNNNHKNEKFRPEIDKDEDTLWS